MERTARPERRFPLLDQWWALIVRGLLAIAFGVLAILLPQLTLIALIALFAAYAIADGITSIIAAIRSKSWGWSFFGGLLSLAAGILTILWPGIAGFALVILIGAWAIVRGAFDIAAAIALRKEINYEWVLALSGMFSILFGLFVIVWPVAGALAIIGIIAAFAMALGVLLIIAGVRQRRMRHDAAGPAPQPAT